MQFSRIAQDAPLQLLWVSGNNITAAPKFFTRLSNSAGGTETL
jgi:hypothetical protein